MQVIGAASGQQSSSTGGSQPTYLYGPRFGLPVVRQHLSYTQLLREIRTDKVDQLLFFTMRDLEGVEGPCLVVYRDGSVAQSHVPPHDFRIPFAMEHHAVTADRLEPQPEASLLEPAPPISERTQQLLKAAPFAALLLVYVAVRVSVSMQGDAEDRDKIKRKEAEERRRAKQQEQQDRVAMEAETMARMGMELPEIRKALGALKIEYDPEELEATVTKAKKAAAATPEGPREIYNTEASLQRAAQEAEKADRAANEEEEDMMAQSEAFLKMKTVKVQKARPKKDPEDKKQVEMQMKLREAQRRLKGVKLQHIDDTETVGFDDVAGIGDAKVELMEIVDFFTKPELFRKSGSRIPKGVLLCGPPGTGKTLLARAVAGEAGVAFLSLNASEFVEMFAGVGAARVRDLFGQARALAPAIIFIDEIDAVGRARGGDQGNDERDQTLNQMLSEMDGFSDDTSVIVMAATNRRDILDPALIRPGRFDRHVFVGLPDYNGRIEIMKVHMSKHSVAPMTEEQLHEVAFETQRFSGAQLANLVNMAAMFAARDAKEEIEYEDFMTALTWERLGPERPPYSGERQRRIAVQEAATALMCTLLPAIEPVVVCTIVPREKYPLGHTVVKINEQRELTRMFTRAYLEQQLLTTLAGRAAEELMYGPEGMSTLNERRLVMARRIVQKLVVSNAMTDNPAIGPRTVSKPARRVGRSIVQAVHRFVTPDMHETVDLEMEGLLNGNYQLVKDMLNRNRAALDALVDALLERNTISGEVVREIVEQHASKLDLDRRKAEAALFI